MAGQRLLQACDMVLRGGNSLAEELGATHPPYTTDCDEAREWYYANYSPAQWIHVYNIWCCWKRIMELRDVLKEHGAGASSL